MTFEDRTASSGIDVTYRNGEEANLYLILESIGGGVGLIDYDRDGLLDVFLTGGGYAEADLETRGYPNRLFRNKGGFQFVDVTKQAGLPDQENELWYSHGCAVGDYDNDGWPDLFVSGYGRQALYRNDHGVLHDVTHIAGLADVRQPHWSTSAAWGDFNGDELPDLFVAQYVDWSRENNPACEGYRPHELRDVCGPRRFQPLPHLLYVNQGDGTFRETSDDSGIMPGKGLGVLAADIDDNQRLDLYVANDTTDNYLYLGDGNGSFREAGLLSGTSGGKNGEPNGSMGVDAADIDGSGRLSLFVTNYQSESHALYQNLGDGQFQHISDTAGISSIGLSFVGFGTSFVDFDGDGSNDIFIANGHAVRYPPAPSTLAQKPILFRNLAEAGGMTEAIRFENVGSRGGSYFRTDHRGRGVALGDLDNDGRIDIVVSHCNEPVALLRNTTDNGHHWVGIELIGKSNRDSVGAKLTLESSDVRLVRTVNGGGSYLSSGDRRVVFGLGNSREIHQLTVRWPSGRTQQWRDLAVDRYWKLDEGD